MQIWALPMQTWRISKKNVSHQLFKSICLGTQLMCYRGLVEENAIKFCATEIGQYATFLFVHKRVWWLCNCWRFFFSLKTHHGIVFFLFLHFFIIGYFSCNLSVRQYLFFGMNIYAWSSLPVWIVFRLYSLIMTQVSLFKSSSTAQVFWKR